MLCFVASRKTCILPLVFLFVLFFLISKTKLNRSVAHKVALVP